MFLQDQSAVKLEDDFSTSDSNVEIPESVVLRKLFPEKQALHFGELEKLVDADILDLTSQLQNQGEEKPTEEEEKEEASEVSQEQKEDN